MSEKIQKQNLDRLKQVMARLSDENLEAQETAVKSIVHAVKSNGDKALTEFSEKFDKFQYDADNKLKIELILKNKPYFNKLTKDLQTALVTAKERISRFHQEEMQASAFKAGWSFSGDLQEKLGVKYQALDSVAVYIPGGQAPLLSTVLMTVIPAQIAGVKRIGLFSPPAIDNGILAVAELCEVTEVYQVGGAQAIAAAAYGTQSITAFDKVVGPGNIYVSLAKKLVFGKVGIDGIFGPSELAIIADDSANPEFIAADLLSQLEHGSGLESTLLVSTNAQILKASQEALLKQIDSLANGYKSPKQIATIKTSLEKWSAFLLAQDLEEAIAIVNYYAPEHLELHVKNNIEKLISSITKAGAIFIGDSSCESLGDYLAGPSHCLPTATSSRFTSGLQCADFLTKTSIIDFSQVNKSDAKFKKLQQEVAQIARAEKLEAHARAMEIR